MSLTTTTYVLGPTPTQVSFGTAQAILVENLGADSVWYAQFTPMGFGQNQGSLNLGDVKQYFSGPMYFAASKSSATIQVTFIPAASTVVSSGSTSSPILFPESYGAKADGVTDDAAAFQSAINALTALPAGGTLKLTPGKTYLLGTVNPKSNVTVEAYGATLKLNTGATTTGMFFSNNGDAVSNFSLCGGTFPGTGAETTFQAIVQINTPSTGADITVRDTLVTNWATGPFYFGNCVRIRALHNTIKGGGTWTGTNAINLLIGQTSGSAAFSTAFCIGNYIDGWCAEGISVGETGNTQVAPLYCVIANNVVRCTSGAGGAGNTPINIEWSTATTGEASQIIVTGNVCEYTGTSVPASGLAVTVSPASNNDPNIVNRVLIAGNHVTSSQKGLTIAGSDITVADNDVYTSGTQGFTLAAIAAGTFTGTGDISNGSPTVNNVSAALVNVPNGSPIVGTGIPSAAYLLSGAGTTTWTLSANATATTTGLAITARSQLQRNKISGNRIRSAAGPTNPIVYLYGQRNSVFSDNLVTCDTGGATTQEGIFTQYCGWLDIVDNRVERAPGHGIRWNISNDVLIARNRIYNACDGASSGFSGISINNASGTVYRIEENVIVDDRGTHQMDQSVAIASGVPTGVVELLSNEMRGGRVGVTTSVTSFGFVKNNVTDVGAWPAATSAPAAPASGTPTTALPYPVVYYVTGGTVTHISLQRSGSSSRDMATTGPATCVLAPGDTMTLTYSVAPTLMLEPLQ